LRITEKMTVLTDTQRTNLQTLFIQRLHTDISNNVTKSLTYSTIVCNADLDLKDQRDLKSTVDEYESGLYDTLITEVTS